MEFLPLTQPQLGIWYTEKMFPDTSINVIAGTLKLRGDIDYPLLKRAVSVYIENNDTLRLRFEEAKQQLLNGAGTQFDRHIVSVFLEIIDNIKDTGLLHETAGRE